MPRFLADADVLSEVTRSRPQAAVMEWLERNETLLVVNPIVLGEIEFGILLLAPGRRRNKLTNWLNEGPLNLPIVALDRTTAQVWANLVARLRRIGKSMPVSDSLIAASAIQHGLTVATRNTNDYRHAGVSLVNPFE